MKLMLQNTYNGLIPMYDNDYDERKKLKIGEVYEAQIKLIRNYEFHKKYFALINCAWSLQSEQRQKQFKNVNLFRKSIELSAGHCELVYSHKLREFIEVPKSIAFDKVDEAEFQEIYKSVRNVIDMVFCKNITIEDFEKHLINF